MVTCRKLSYNGKLLQKIGDIWCAILPFEMNDGPVQGGKLVSLVVLTA